MATGDSVSEPESKPEQSDTKKISITKQKSLTESSFARRKNYDTSLRRLSSVHQVKLT